MEKNWLQLLHDAADTLDEEAAEVRAIAKALKRVGNDNLANELIDISVRLNMTEYNIREATGKKTTSDVRDALGVSRAILNSCLITSGMSKEEVKKRRGLTQ